MEETLKRPSAATSLSAVHGGSFKPKIRIIHLFAPEVIKTDAANFRDLVQRLTGKPISGAGTGGRRKKKTTTKKARTVSEASLPPREAREVCGVEEGPNNGYFNMLGDLNLVPLSCCSSCSCSNFDV
ncbi:hypothetical protein QJS10_CPB19g00963 [Acorus calamus]|uniref:VQ domain-containing protein n=1 Tax=Acorus calamus TaxID=4465 RepID=A0AAV9CHS4_ACOCL|nr:hypothetical protein QJS10_CPB19g00963 [Acorus calamus]